MTMRPRLARPLAWLLLAAIAGCMPAPSRPAERLSPEVQAPRLRITTESPLVDVLNGQQLKTTVVVNWEADATPEPVTLSVEIEEKRPGVRARLGTNRVPVSEGETSVPLTVSVTETAPAGEYVVLIAAHTDSGKTVERKLTVKVPPKY